MSNIRLGAPSTPFKGIKNHIKSSFIRIESISHQINLTNSYVYIFSVHIELLYTLLVKQPS